jgi:hypothetical protein
MRGTPVSLLDNIRISNGPEGLRRFFSEMLHTDRNRLLELLSDRRLHFGTLYLLKPDIISGGLREALPGIYKKALELSDELCGVKTDGTLQAGRRITPVRRRTGTGPSGRSREGGKTQAADMIFSDTVAAPALGWIAETGWDNDMPEDSYELLMERCTALLLARLRHKPVLPAIADTIFSRHRQGRLIHNLVWAFFEARDRESLYLVAQKLGSPDRRDIALARKLLRFIPGTDDDAMSGPALYYGALKWLSENMPFIYYTGESMQMCPKPLYYAISYEAKYLGRQVSADSCELPGPLRDHENEQLTRFRSLDETQKQLLADVSCALYRQDKHRWESWIRLPVSDQLASAAIFTEGSV